MNPFLALALPAILFGGIAVWAAYTLERMGSGVYKPPKVPPIPRREP